jgi:hypothetical protein
MSTVESSTPNNNLELNRYFVYLFIYSLYFIKIRKLFHWHTTTSTKSWTLSNHASILAAHIRTSTTIRTGMCLLSIITCVCVTQNNMFSSRQTSSLVVHLMRQHLQHYSNLHLLLSLPMVLHRMIWNLMLHLERRYDS